MKKTIILLVVLGAGVVWYENLSRSGKAIAEVTVPELSAVAQVGAVKFETYCASCHGANAGGQKGVAPPLVHIFYESGHHGDEAFYRAARFGVRAHHWPFGNMPPVEGIKRDEVRSIITYIRELQRANGFR